MCVSEAQRAHADAQNRANEDRSKITTIIEVLAARRGIAEVTGSTLLLISSYWIFCG
jgi:hypothetical protein